eukprot:2096159-Alexandrium_andersonii.AAC.1
MDGWYIEDPRYPRLPFAQGERPLVWVPDDEDGLPWNVRDERPDGSASRGLRAPLRRPGGRY